MDRREFIGGAACAGAAAAMGTLRAADGKSEIRAVLLHPELAVKGSWSPDRMRAELKKLRAITFWGPH